MEKIVVCDDFLGDPLTDIAADLDYPGKPQFMLVSDLLEREGFRYDSQTATLLWDESGWEGGRNTKILDRVIELSPKTVDKIGKGEGLLQRGQILDRYDAVLKHYGTARPNMRYSTVGRLHPLPTQWHLVEQAALQVAIPKYRYGYGPEPIETDDFLAPVFKSAFDLYKWKPNEPAVDEQPWDLFAVDVPPGDPIVTYFLGDDQYIAPLRDGESRPTDEVREELFALMSKIAGIFGDPQCGEILWYVDDRSFTFGAFSHFLSGASMTPSFVENGKNFFDRYFSRDPVLLTA